MALKKKYYAVARGRIPGIYTRWPGADGAEVQVRGYPGAIYKGFASREAAEAFLRQGHAIPAEKKKSPVPRKRPTVSTAACHEGQVRVFTDGGALGNPGPGGWGVVIRFNGEKMQLSGGYRRTTNNRMELMACISALQVLKPPVSIALYSDSKYVVDGISKGWARSWRARGWKKSNGAPALNSDLWARLLDLSDEFDVHFHWVKGHAGHEDNERCDQLAKAAAAGDDLPVDSGYETG